MTVEIREISISMTLVDEPVSSPLAPEQGISPAPRIDAQALQDACVEAVLRILRDKREA